MLSKITFVWFVGGGRKEKKQQHIFQSPGQGDNQEGKLLVLHGIIPNTTQFRTRLTELTFMFKSNHHHILMGLKLATFYDMKKAEMSGEYSC